MRREAVLMRKNLFLAEIVKRLYSCPIPLEECDCERTTCLPMFVKYGINNAWGECKVCCVLIDVKGGISLLLGWKEGNNQPGSSREESKACLLGCL